MAGQAAGSGCMPSSAPTLQPPAMRRFSSPSAPRSAGSTSAAPAWCVARSSIPRTQPARRARSSSRAATPRSLPGDCCAWASRPRTSAATASSDSRTTAGISQRDERWLGPNPQPPAVASGGGSFEHVGYTVGAGLQAALGRALAITLDLRRTAVGTFDMDLPGHYWSIAVGASRRW